MKKVLWRFVISFLFFLMIPVSYVYAKDIYALDEIVVTATRTERRVRDVPASVTVITAEELKQKNLVTLDDALKNVPGIFAKRSKGLMDTTASVNMRGFQGDKYVLVMVDGQPMNDAYTNGVMWAELPVDSIERIEIIRGGASALYGGNAMGGVINIITKSADKTMAHITGGYGTHDSYKFNMGMGTRIKDKVSVRLGYDFLKTGGYETTPAVVTKSAGAGTLQGGYAMDSATGQPTRWVVGDRGKQTAERHNLNGKVVWDYSDDGSLTFSTMFSRMEYDYDSPNTYVGTFGTNITEYVQAGDGFRAPVNGSTFIYYTGMGTYDTQTYALALSDLVGRVKINAKLNYMWGEDKYTLAAATNAQYTYWDAPGTVKISNNQTWFGEVTADVPFLKAHVLTLGASYRLDNSDTDDYTIPYYRSYDGKSASTMYVGGKAQTIGLFFQEEWKPVENFRLYVGGRLDIWTGMNGQTKDYANSEYFSFADNTETSFSPKVAIVYQPIPETTLRASVGRSFRAPTVYEMYRTWVSGTRTYYANPFLQPETVWNYEAGMDQRLFNGWTVASVSVYYNDIDNLIYNSTEGNSVYRKNAGTARTFGIEVAATQKITSWLSVSGNFTYTDAKIKSNPTDRASEGKRVTGIPEYMANVGVDFSYQWVRANVTGRYFSKTYNSSDNSDTKDGVYGTYEPSFTMDAKVTVTPKKWVDVSFIVENMWDEKTYQYYPTEGRRFFVEATFRY